MVSKLINQIMRDGRESTAQGIVYGALDLIKKRVRDKEPLEVLLTAIDAVKPYVEVRSKRAGSAIYQVPMRVTGERQQLLAIRAIIQDSRERARKPMVVRVADAILEAFKLRRSKITWR